MTTKQDELCFLCSHKMDYFDNTRELECFNRDCGNGRINSCMYLQGGHLKNYSHILFLMIGLLFVLVFCFVIFIHPLVNTFFVVLGVFILVYGMLSSNDCPRCGGAIELIDF